MKDEKPKVSRRTVLTGLTLALTPVAYLNSARQSTAHAVPAAPAAKKTPAHPSYRSIVGLL